MDRGEILYRARRAKRMSQEHLASVSGISVRTIRRAEGGEDVSGESLRCLCAVLEIEAESLPDAAPVPVDAARPDPEPEPFPVTVQDRPAPREVDPLRGRGRAIARFLAMAGTLPGAAATALLLAGAWPPGAAPAVLLALAQSLPALAYPALSRRMDPPYTCAFLGFGGLYGIYLSVLWLIFFGAGKPPAVLAAELVVLVAGIGQAGLAMWVRHREDLAEAHGRPST